jgi:general secretion pathway protein C
VRLRRFWGVGAIGVVLGVSWNAIAFAGLQTTTRLIATVEQLYRLVDAMNTAGARAPPPPLCVPSPTVTPATSDGRVGLGIMRLDATKFLVERRVIDGVLEHLDNQMRRTRVVPYSKNGRVVGLTLFGVRPDSLFGYLGIENGDRVDSINGIAMSTPENVLAAYAGLLTSNELSNELSVLVTRRGSRVRFEYYLV